MLSRSSTRLRRNLPSSIDGPIPESRRWFALVVIFEASTRSTRPFYFLRLDFLDANLGNGGWRFDIRDMKIKWLGLLLLVIGSLGVCSAFQSDELPEEDDEWGLIREPRAGGVRAASTGAPVQPSAPSIRNTAANSRAPPAADKKVQFTLEHSFGGSEFKPAGVFTARVRESLKGAQTLLKFRLSRNAFTDAEKSAFQTLLDNDDFYSIRVPADVMNPGDEYILSSVKARCLSLSNFQERFDFHVDQAHVIGVTYSSTVSCPYPRPLRTPSQWSFDSLIVSKSSEQVLRSLTHIDAFEATGDEVSEDGTLVKKIPEKSFWAKYWMYMIPLGLIVLNAISQVANLPEEGAPGQGPPGAQQRLPAGGGGPRRR
ncbi:hypothetical protein R1sor_012882 [Riccia sorocarpa]|uniref:ER membrane protein complex subunit 10 n=1 Tax=Riccia sorocarpa TaxID=122646 RepID=A0ABD3I663_9MARC